MTQDSGGTFDLLSVRVGSLGRDSDDDGNLTFTGFIFGGGSVSLTLTTTAVPNTAGFSGFTNLTSVVVSTTDGFFPVMDDLTIADATPTAVPEPATIALLGSGLVGAAIKRRRQRSNA